MRSHLRLLVLGALPVLVLTMAPAHAVPGEPTFDRAGTEARVSGRTVTVNFAESGLRPGAEQEIAVTATISTRAACGREGSTSVSLAETTVARRATFTADARGRLEGRQRLPLGRSEVSVTVDGVRCKPSRSISVVVEDLGSGARLSFRGARPGPG